MRAFQGCRASGEDGETTLIDGASGISCQRPTRIGDGQCLCIRARPGLSASFLAMLNRCGLKSIHCHSDPNSQRNLLRKLKNLLTKQRPCEMKMGITNSIRTIRIKHSLIVEFQGPLNGGVSNGGVSRSGLVLPFLSFFVLLGLSRGFSRFARGWSGDFPDLSFSSFSAY